MEDNYKVSEEQQVNEVKTRTPLTIVFGCLAVAFSLTLIVLCVCAYWHRVFTPNQWLTMEFYITSYFPLMMGGSVFSIAMCAVLLKALKFSIRTTTTVLLGTYIASLISALVAIFAYI